MYVGDGGNPAYGMISLQEKQVESHIPVYEAVCFKPPPPDTAPQEPTYETLRPFMKE